MKDIKKEVLREWTLKYKEDSSNAIIQHALVKNSITSVSHVPEEQKNLTFHFNVSIDTLPATNQLASGRCWIFAGCNVIREKLAKKYNLANFELSQSYIAFYDKLEKANYFMETIAGLSDSVEDERVKYQMLTGGIEDGGQWDMFVALVKKYGVVPQEVMPETYQSSNTLEINRLINTKLRQFASFVEEKRINIDALKEKILEDIYTILLDCYGVPPLNFSFEYTDKSKQYHILENLTPLTFYEDYCDINLDDYISIINSPTKDKPYHHMFSVKYLGNVIEDSKVKFLNLPLEEFKSVIISQLKALEPVWFGCDCNQEFARDESIWDDELLDYDTAFGTSFEMSKEECLNTYESVMNHAMVLIGVNLDNDIPNRWKIENSWGTSKGKKGVDGYYIASDTWFDKFVYQAVVHKKYLTKKL